MVTFFLSLGVSSLMGLLAGMGVGGGSLLLLWLTEMAMIPQAQARIINLLFFLPAAMISTLFRRRQKMLEPDITVPGILGGCVSAVLFTLLSFRMDVTLLKKGLGALLIFTGIKELLYRPRNAK